MAGFGGSVKLTGESEYRKAIKNITQDLQSMSTALKNQATSFSTSDSKIKSSAAAQKQLNDTIKNQSVELAKAKTSLAQYSVQLQAQTTRHNALSREYKNAVTELDRIKKTSGETSTEYKKQAEVVDKLGQELAESTEELNESKTAMAALKSEINNSNKVINNAKNDLNDLGEEAEDTGKQAEKAGDGFTVMKGVLSNLASQAITGAINGLKKLGGAFVNVGKQAIESYAQYEQLVGGVETLFKDSAGRVEKYANNAYKTAGISANTYMEQITSFSASLLQGLGGDTEKAAKIGNMAITDMSDNANKMGTSIEMIQNAYQGFAKQNYTMLDNLKLGYGGTKSEMARLVKESGILGKAGDKLTAKNLDQKVSFDQIIKAINITQKRMGITGTTAKEAASTIEGSVNSMKAAWQNLLTGIADDNQDLGKLIDNFVKSVITAGNNLVPRIKQVVDGIKRMINSLINEVFPKLKQQVPELRPLIETFEWFIKNKDLVVGSVSLMIGAFAAYKIASFTASLSGVVTGLIDIAKGSAVATAATTANTAATAANTTAHVAATGATGALTAATNLLNAAWKANPIGLVITGVTALIGVFGLLSNSTQKQSEVEKTYNRALEESTNKIEKQRKAYEDLKEAKQAELNQNMTQMTHYKSLADELDTLVDKNGKVKKGYEERASFIATTLSEALGIEIKQQDGVIKGYEKIRENIDKTIEKKKAEAILQSQEALYTEAINNRAAASQNLIDIENQLHSAEKAKADNLDLLKQKEKELHDEWDKGNLASQGRLQMIRREIDDLKEKDQELGTSVANFRNAYSDQEKIVQEYAYNIDTYEQNMAAAHKENYDQMSTVTWEQVRDYKDAGDVKKAQLEAELATERKTLETLKKEKDENGNYLYKSQVEQGEKRIGELKKNLKQYNSTTKTELDANKVQWNNGLDKVLSEITGKNVEFKEDGKGNVTMYADGVKQGEPTSKKEMAKLVTNTIKEVTKKDKDAKKAGEDIINGVNNGVKAENIQSSVFSSIRSFGSKLLSNLKSSLKEKSPSKATREMGEFLVKGLEIGINREQPKALKAAEKLAKQLLQTIQKDASSISSVSKDYVTTFNNSITNAIKNSETKVKGLIDNHFKNLKSTNEKQQKKLQKEIDKTSDKTKKKRLKKQLQALKDQNKEIQSLYNNFGKNAITQFNKAMEAATNGVTSELTANIQALADEMQKEIDEVEKKIDSMKSKLMDYGTLFETVKTEAGEEIFKLSDISKEIETLRQYSSNLNNLKEKISDELMDEIVGMSVDDAIKYTDELMKMSDEDLQAYNDLYQEKIREATEISNQFYQSKVNEIKTNYTDKMKAEFEKAKAQLETIGKQTMEGFIKGMKKSNYIKEVKAMAQSVISTMKKELGIKSPSRVFMEIGEYSGEGYNIGLADTLKNVKGVMASMIPIASNIQATRISNIPGATEETNGNMVDDFKEALSGMTIELDDEKVGKFVERTVADAIYT